MIRALLFIICGLPLIAQTVDVSPRKRTIVSFAGLGSPASGHGVYCDDCQETSPCTGGGTGANADRIAGTWSCRNSSDSGNTATIASGSQALATAPITAQTCATVIPISAAGVLSTDTIDINFNADVSAVIGYAVTGNLLTILVYPTADTINIKVCNRNDSDVTPGAATVNYKVTRATGGTATMTVYSGTATLGESAITAGTCASVINQTAAGVLTTDTVDYTFNGDVSAVAGYAVTGDIVLIYVWPDAGSVKIKVCNPNATDLDPGAAFLNIKVTR